MYLRNILYVLFGEPNVELQHFLGSKEMREIKRMVNKHFKKDSYFRRYSVKFLDAKTGDRDEKTGWINVELYVYTILGGERFFYCTLKALLQVCKKALTDKEYDFLPIMDWNEGIVEYLVYEVLGSKKL